jgi:site-specific recombinase XerD
VCKNYPLSYEDIRYIFRRVREELAIKKEKKEKKLPTLLTLEEVKKLMKEMEKTNAIHLLLFKLLFFTGIRISELVRLKVGDIFIEEKKIKISKGKGEKDRYVLFPENLVGEIRRHVYKRREEDPLFFSEKTEKPFTPRRIQQIIKKYADMAGISKRVYPHLLRHMIFTLLHEEGMSKDAIQLLAGHTSPATTQIYTHLSLAGLRPKYEEIIRKVHF